MFINTYQTVLAFPSTPTIKNSEQIYTTTTSAGPPSQTVSTAPVNTGINSANVSKHLYVPHQTRQSAILDIQQSSDLPSALIRFDYLPQRL